MKLELYYFEECPYCQIVLKQIKILGIENKIIYSNTRTNSNAKAYHLKQTGRSTVPCLYINDKPMFESKDISDWLAKNIKLL